MLLKIERKPYSSTYPPLGSGGQVDFQFQEKEYDAFIIVMLLLFKWNVVWKKVQDSHLS